MKSAIISTMALGALMLCACSSPSVENGMGVTVKYDSSTKTVAIGCDGRQVLGGVYASYKLGDRMVSRPTCLGRISRCRLRSAILMAHVVTQVCMKAP